eukprot:s2756_g2.t1
MVSLYPNWNDLQKGDIVDLVATMVVYDEAQQNHLMSELLSRTLFTFHGTLPKSKLTYSLLNMEVWQPMPRPILFNAVDSRVLHHQGCNWDSVHEAIEICAGVGGLGLGSMACGFIPMTACDTNELFLELYQKHMPIPTVCGDINDMLVVAQLWEHCPRSTSLCSGIACQPYSVIGDGLGGQDPRSRTLPGTLRAAHFLRSITIVLECVKPAQQDPYVQQQISSFCRQTGFHAKEAILQLSDALPCSRARWWCILSAPALGPIPIKPMPLFKDISMIEHVMTKVLVWPDEHEKTLELQPHERQAFQVDDLGSSPYLIDMKSILPCPLHSWGSQMRPCACRCRSAGLSMERIQNKGLFGVVVRSESHVLQQGCSRHIHPKECAALVGFDPTIDLDTSPMLHLAAMGQIASPVQATWVYGHIASHLDLLQFGHKPLEPVDHLMAYRAWLLNKCQVLWPAAGPQDSSAPLARISALLQPFAKVPMDVFLAYNGWTAPRSVMCLAAAVHQLREQEGMLHSGHLVVNTGAAAHLTATCPDSQESESLDRTTSSPTESTCSLIDGSNCYMVKTSPEMTVQDLAYAEGMLRGWSVVCIRCPEDTLEVTPKTLVAGLSLCLSGVDGDLDYGWCRIEVPSFSPDASPQTPMDWDEPETPVPASVVPTVEKPGDETMHEPSYKQNVVVGLTDPVCNQSGIPLRSSSIPSSPVESSRLLEPGVSMPPLPASDAKAYHQQLFGRSPLTQLDRAGLCHLGTPYPLTSFQLSALLTQVITRQDRLAILDQQELSWADDEVSWHLCRIVSQVNAGCSSSESTACRVVLLPTLLLHGWVHVDASQILPWLETYASPSSTLVGVFNVDQHWVPLLVVPGHPMRVSTYDCRESDHSKLDPVIAQIMKFTKATEVATCRAVRLFSDQDGCGPMSLAFVAHSLLQKMMPVTNHDVGLLHTHLRAMFATEALVDTTCVKPWIWGNGPKPVDAHEDVPMVSRSTVLREFSRVTVKSAGQEFHLFLECGTCIPKILSLLTSESIPTLRSVTISDGLHGMTPLPEDLLATPDDLLLFVDSPCQLLLSEKDFVDSDWPYVILLHSRGILVLWRRAGMIGFDVEQAVENFDFEWEAPLQNHIGQRLVEDSTPPNVLFLGATSVVRDFWEFVSTKVSFQPLAEGFMTCVSVRDVYPFTHWLHKTGILALIRTCGWQLLTSLNVDTDDVPKELFLLARSDRLAMSTRALCQLVLTRIFLMQLRLYEEAPQVGEDVYLSVKLWKSWIWHGVAGGLDTTEFIHRSWHFAHQIFGDSTPIRLVAHGGQVNPDWPMHHYAKRDSQGRLTLKVHVVLQLTGGGPATLQSPRSIHESLNFDELEELDQSDSTRLISVLVQNMVDRPAAEVHMDLGTLRDATFRVDHSGFSLVSTVAVVIRFMRDLQANGIEPLLRALGWHTAMSLLDYRDPPQVQLHITPKVGVRHIRDSTVKIFLMYALAIRAMPVPRGVLGGVYVKIKLVDSWVLVGHFPEDMTMGSFTSSWNAATSLFGNPSHMSIICASKQVSADSRLGDHVRVNDSGERFVKVFLVLHLQGGGPKNCDAAPSDVRPLNRWTSRRFATGRGERLETPTAHNDSAQPQGAVIRQVLLCDEIGSDPQLVSLVYPPFDRVLATTLDDKVTHIITYDGQVTIAMILHSLQPDALPEYWDVCDIFGNPLAMHDSVQHHRSVFFSKIDSPEDARHDNEPMTRVAWLVQQQHKVAPDEISYYLQSRAAGAQFRFLPCLCVTAAAGSHRRNSQIRAWIEDIVEHSMAFGQPVASVCLVDGHWTPFVAHVAFDSIQIQTTVCGQQMVRAIEVCCHQPHYRPHHTPPLWYRLPINFLLRSCSRVFADDCGFQSVIWLLNHMRTRTPKAFLRVPEAKAWREDYLIHLICQGTAFAPVKEPLWALGGGATDPENMAWVPASNLAQGLAVPHSLNQVWITQKLYHRSGLCCEYIDGQGWKAEDSSHAMHATWIGNCFLPLNSDQLPLQDAPVPETLQQLHVIRSLSVSRGQRLAILANQDYLWADDELIFHFARIQEMAAGQDCQIVVLDPMLATGWMAHRSVPDPGIWSQHCHAVITALKVQFHWVPLVLTRTGHVLNVHTWEHRTRTHPSIASFLARACASWGCSDFRWIIYHTRQVIEHACGPMAVALVLHVILQVPAPRGISDIDQTQISLRNAFKNSLSAKCLAPRMWASGVNEQAADELRPILVDHGVPADVAQSRAQAAVKAIGGSQILGALASKIPWKQLKTLGNQVKFQFLLPAELQDKINQNAGKGAVGRPKGTKRGKKNPQQDREVQLDPTKLCLPDGFFAAGGKSLAQIPLNAVGPLAEGVALVTHSEASPYLQQGQTVSNHPLALLIVQPVLPLQTSLANIQVTVPCKCLANNEPVLLDGVLCQIGKGFVEKGQSNSQIAVDVVSVGTLKFTVFRDEIDGTWEAFIGGPLRYIVAKVPLLRLCTQPNCQCHHWHNPEGLATKEVIVDVWRRQFLQSNYRPETAPQATLYSVCIRLPESLIASVLTQSGTAGIYAEPRTLDARSVHPDYAMVWLPKMNRSQLNHLKQTTPAAIGLGRVGERVGIRVLSTDAATVHAALKPEAVFLPSGPRHEFLTGPFPFGSDRNSLMRAFKALHWEARPVQPMSSVDAEGSMWLVQANQEPPDTILTMAHGDVVVTRYRPTKEARDPKSRPIASAATLALCGGQQTDTKDPWINSDPWGGYQATTARHPVAPEATEGLRQLETKLENKLKKAVLDSIPSSSSAMERDDVPDRVYQLESQMSQLLGRQQQLEAQVSETAAAQASQIASVQGQLQTQHQLLHGHIESSQQNIAAMFESQMAQIRTLMAKRPRDEQEAVVTATFIRDMWVTLGTVYGESAGQWHPNQLQNNEILVREIANHVCFHATGLRVVAGDFNNTEFDLPAFQILRDAGFRDLQTIAAERWGCDIQNTCKCATRVDFCFVSPELQSLLVEVHVDQTVWPDHAVLAGTYVGGNRDVPRFLWKLPQPLQWPSYDVDKVDDIDTGHATAAYAKIWQAAESAAVQASVVPVRRACLGRAATLAPKKVFGQAHAPLRPAREQPQFFGTSVQHAHWYRQARRLQAYCRYVNSSKLPKECTHGAQVWGSIVRAKGFAPHFPEWWTHLQHRAPGAPDRFPMTPPSMSVATAIYDTCVIALRQLERKLRANSRAYAIARRQADPRLIYQDIRQISPDSVEMLVKPSSSKIVDVDHDTGCIHLQNAVQWDLTQPVYTRGHALGILHVEANWLWVEDTSDVTIGASVSQLVLKGDLEELFQLFQDDWSKRWLRHKDVPPSQWQEILSFAASRLRPVACTHVDVDEHCLSHAVRSKKSRTSKGLDGVSLADMRAAPVTLLHNFCTLYRHATVSGEWPSQLISGKIASLAKCANPGSPADFRPITVFGLGYRLWTSIQCKQLLTDLDPVLPSGLFGNRRGCHPAQLWAYLLWTIEECQAIGRPASGLMADIVKAFNHLPRPVVSATLDLLGVPAATMTAWNGAIKHMNRHFQIRGSFSSATPSCTGYAEGDGMSILAMLAINTLFHTWFEASQVPIQPLSFVDDWQLLLRHHCHASYALDQLDRFCTLVDLQLDRNKTFAWSLDAEGRKNLRSTGMRVLTHCRTLGAHMQLCRRHTNKTLQQRVHSLQDTWDRLRWSPCPYKAKVLCLTTAAWPRGLHGVAATSLSSQTLGRLRSGAMRGLGADSSGANPWIHLGLVESPDHDPGFWSVIQTLRCARECGAVDWILPVLCDLAESSRWEDPNSFSCTIVTRCHTLGWQFEPTGCLRDAFGTFCLFHSSFPEILLRAEIAWQSVVWQAVSHRPGLCTLPQVDARSTRKFLASLGPEDAGMMRTILNGTHFTGEAKQYWVDDEQGICPFCHCSDSRFHRFWQCDAFAEDRASLTEAQWAMVPVLPEALTCYGWVMRASCWDAWFTQLATPVPAPSLGDPFQIPDTWLDVFTDGSCLWPQKSYRLAAWAVVQASPLNSALCSTSSKILAAGHVSGLLQSAYRAELTAVCMALRVARQKSCAVRIWCDCQGVVDGVRKLLTRSRRIRVNGRHSDLWFEVDLLLSELGRECVQITKVAAHQDITNTVSGFDAWCFLYNGLADQAAQLANLNRTEEFWLLHKQFVAETDSALSIAHALQRIMLSISRRILFHQVQVDKEPLEDAAAHPAGITLAKPLPWQALPEETPVSEPILRRFGHRVVQMLVSWFYHGLIGPHLDQARWISFYQLYIDYMLATGESGPLHFDTWEDPQKYPHVDLIGVAFKKRCSWFTHVLKTVLTDLHIKFQTKFTRTESHMLLVVSVQPSRRAAR